MTRRFLIAATVLLFFLIAPTTDAAVVKGEVISDRPPPRKFTHRYDDHKVEPDMEKVSKPIPPVVLIAEPAKVGTPVDPDGHYEIRQVDFCFEPNLLVIPVGAAVDFPNMDPKFHNVFSYSKTKRFDLGRYPAGESKSVVFDSPGIVKVYCEVHKWMQAVIVVVENEYYAVPDADGSFEIEGIPPGSYKLMIWDLYNGEKFINVELGEDEVFEINKHLSD